MGTTVDVYLTLPIVKLTLPKSTPGRAPNSISRGSESTSSNRTNAART